MRRQPQLLEVVDALGRRAASLADWTAGSKRAIRTAMIAITTKSSIKVNPEFFLRKGHLPIGITRMTETVPERK